jgi:hypothetical protein
MVVLLCEYPRCDCGEDRYLAKSFQTPWPVTVCGVVNVPIGAEYNFIGQSVEILSQRRYPMKLELLEGICLASIPLLEGKLAYDISSSSLLRRYGAMNKTYRRLSQRIRLVHANGRLRLCRQ